MNRDDIAWTGSMPALTTPFLPDGAVDEAGFAANLDRLLAAGATGSVVAGCTGEFWALSLDEKARLGRLAVETTRGRGPVILGAAAVTPSAVLEIAHAAKEAGCDAALVTPPYFVRVNDSELVAHYERVARDAPLPVMVYNIPGNAGNALTPAVADILADIPQIVAIKESSGNWNTFHGVLNAAGDRVKVFCGPSSVFGVAATLAGADGLIDCFPNMWTDCLRIWDTTRAGDMATAWELQRTGMALTELFTTGGRSLYPATKAAMDLLGYPGGGAVRPPLEPLSGEPLAELRRELGKYVRTAEHA